MATHIIVSQTTLITFQTRALRPDSLSPTPHIIPKVLQEPSNSPVHIHIRLIQPVATVSGEDPFSNMPADLRPVFMRVILDPGLHRVLDVGEHPTNIVVRMRRTVSPVRISKRSLFKSLLILVRAGPARNAVAALLTNRIHKVIQRQSIAVLAHILNLCYSLRVTMLVFLRVDPQLIPTCRVVQVVDRRTVRKLTVGKMWFQFALVAHLTWYSYARACHPNPVLIFVTVTWVHSAFRCGQVHHAQKY